MILKATFTLSGPLVTLIHDLFAWLSGLVNLLKLSGFISLFLAEGLIGGVGSVVAFAPLIFILFLMIAILEDSGYLGRYMVSVKAL